MPTLVASVLVRKIPAQCACTSTALASGHGRKWRTSSALVEMRMSTRVGRYGSRERCRREMHRGVQPSGVLGNEAQRPDLSLVSDQYFGNVEDRQAPCLVEKGWRMSGFAVAQVPQRMYQDPLFTITCRNPYPSKRKSAVFDIECTGCSHMRLLLPPISILPCPSLISPLRLPTKSR